MKTIDYLFEDPPIPNQKYALVSIVGPNMPQKCNVWGLKLRGVCDTLDKAKHMTQKLMKIDNDYDIYTVEVGKFFPLQVEPHDVGQVEYGNSQLNELIKSYLENRELANEQWQSRKNEMIKEAIREGKAQEELSNKPEHPIAVLQRIKNFEQSIAEVKEHLDTLTKDLDLSRKKFELYTNEEKQIANKELESAIKDTTQESSSQSNLSVDDVRKQLMDELKLDTDTNNEPNNEIESIIKEIKEYETELDELVSLKMQTNEGASPNVYSRIQKQINSAQSKLHELKAKLNDANAINSYINSKYTNSQYEYLNSEPSTRRE